MMHSDSSTTASASGATPLTAVHGDIIRTHILNRLDGPTLASTSCASSELLSLCNGDDHLWRQICNATWPSTTSPAIASAVSSFPSGHRSLYSDSFPALNPNDPLLETPTTTPPCERLISAVDIFHGHEPVCSKVLDTETTSSWFLSAPFRLDLLGPKETVAVENGSRLRVSWILIDPRGKRAVNVASREAVEARRHWLTGDVQLRFATVVAGVEPPMQCAVVVTCGGKDAHVREVSLQVEDVEGKVLAGRDSLVILRRAMEGQRCKFDGGRMERESYEMFLKRRSEFREWKLRREKNLDMVCVVAGVLFSFAILVLSCWR